MPHGGVFLLGWETLAPTEEAVMSTHNEIPSRAESDALIDGVH